MKLTSWIAAQNKPVTNQDYYDPPFPTISKRDRKQKQGSSVGKVSKPVKAGGPGSGCRGDNCGRPGKGTFAYQGKTTEDRGQYPKKYSAEVHRWAGTGQRDIGGRFVRTIVELHTQPQMYKKSYTIGETAGPRFIVEEKHRGEADSLDAPKITDRKEFTSIQEAHEHLKNAYGIEDRKFPASRPYFRLR